MSAPSKASTRRVLITVYALLLLATVVAIGIAHGIGVQGQHQRALEKLGSITSTLAAQLNGHHVVRLQQKYSERGLVIKSTQDPWYYVLHQHLRRAATANALEHPIHLVSYDSIRQELQIVVTSEDPPRFREPLALGKAPLLAGYRTGGRIDPTREHAELLAFDAVTDNAAQVVGVVMTSLPAADLQHGAWVRTARNTAIAMGLFGLAGLVLFGSVGRWLRRQERAHQAMAIREAEMNESIAYVRKIQDAFIPPATSYSEAFHDHFVLLRPKGEVSGDFHWYHRVDDHRTLVAAADCTGHGLPGAMLSAIGCSLLNELARASAEPDPAELLSALDERVADYLRQHGRRIGGGDGMDVALCLIDTREHILLFAGACRPLYRVHDGQLTIINGDRTPVGGAHRKGTKRFTCHRIAVRPGDRLYLFSDGYVDQLGGPAHERFRRDRFDRLLVDHQHLSLRDQAAVLEKAFLDWKGEAEQVDDVCLLGLQV